MRWQELQNSKRVDEEMSLTAVIVTELWSTNTLELRGVKNTPV
jgi:hypothetical protein